MSAGPATAIDLAGRVRDWIADDPDPVARAELQSLLDAGADEELERRFASELKFGTAGLRGHLGAGPARMNRATVRRATAGLVRFLLEEVAGAATAGVMIGHDARHGSAEFAEEAARVITGAGVKALTLPPRVPTPVLAFATLHFSCAAGVMITASHNPPQDNGYKVYLADGAQIVSPVDDAIAERIRAVTRLADVPLGSQGEALGDGVMDAYVRTIARLARGDDQPHLEVVYTPLHGVGRDVLLSAFERAGFAPPRVVAAQGLPDPDFPTLARPNPEEPGALDLALAEAKSNGAELILVNDPDADRLAVAIPNHGGDWRILSGDEVGALLAYHLLTHRPAQVPAVVASTVASSTLLARMAHAFGAEHRETLTGFKWIMHSAADRRHDPLLFGYEEALGYAVDDAVRDKDGISAALLMVRAALEARRDGICLGGRLDQLAVRFGLHATRQVVVELSNGAHGADAENIMRRLRTRPPQRLLDEPVTETEDLLAGERLPRSDVMIFRCRERIRAVVRPSGTEPKLKMYLQVVEEMRDGAAHAVRRRASQRLVDLARELQQVVLG
jgi:phosphomannomutase